MAYQTKQGEQLRAFLSRHAQKHWTAVELEHALNAQGVQIGKTTVYRHLEKLVAAGEVRRFSADDASACYQFASPCPEIHTHYHLKCENCGTLLHTRCGFLDDMAEHILQKHRFTFRPERTVLYGLCAQCGAKQEGKM